MRPELGHGGLDITARGLGSQPAAVRPHVARAAGRPLRLARDLQRPRPAAGPVVAGEAVDDALPLHGARAAERDLEAVASRDASRRGDRPGSNVELWGEGVAQGGPRRRVEDVLPGDQDRVASESHHEEAPRRVAARDEGPLKMALELSTAVGDHLDHTPVERSAKRHLYLSGDEQAAPRMVTMLGKGGADLLASIR